MNEEKNLIQNRDKYGLVNWFSKVAEENGSPDAILRLRLALVSEICSDPSVVPWFEEYVARDIQSKINSYLNFNAIKLLCNQGLPPTSGYQLNEEQTSLYNLNENHSEVLKQFIPPDIKNLVTINDFYNQRSNPLEAVEEELGVPFFSNLITVIKMRIRFIDYTVLGTYLEEIIQGISFQIGVDITDFITDNLSQEIITKAVEGGFDPLVSPVHAIDILSALGHSKECVPDPNRNIFITEKGNNELLKVFNPLWRKNLLHEAEFPQSLV